MSIWLEIDVRSDWFAQTGEIRRHVQLSIVEECIADLTKRARDEYDEGIDARLAKGVSTQVLFDYTLSKQKNCFVRYGIVDFCWPSMRVALSLHSTVHSGNRFQEVPMLPPDNPFQNSAVVTTPRLRSIRRRLRKRRGADLISGVIPSLSKDSRVGEIFVLSLFRVKFSGKGFGERRALKELALLPKMTWNGENSAGLGPLLHWVPLSSAQTEENVQWTYLGREFRD